jgi:HCOMODA/2-hydroxy-3-carboxy-muconic semialdehyde decarboxylase
MQAMKEQAMAPGTSEERLAQMQAQVRKAARAMGRHGLVHAFGHVSARLNDTEFLVCAARPMGCLDAADQGTVVPVEGPLPQGVLGEVRLHQQIYKARPDVGGICRILPARVIALSTMRLTPSARHGNGSYFAPHPPLWDDPQLIRDDDKARAIAAMLGGARAIVMRGNGAVVAGSSIEEAAGLSFLLEEAAALELTVRAIGDGQGGTLLSAAEASARAVFTGGIFERLWEFLTHGDPEQTGSDLANIS